MARKLKTFLTQSGFYDLAVAAPSMQAALDAWGFTHNAFHQGFAAETDDPAIVAATLAAPGIVLKRAVGTTDLFQEDAAPPTSLPAKAGRPTPKPKKASPKPPRKISRAAILSFEKAKAAREKKQARERQALERRHAARARKVAAAQAGLKKARAAHEKRAAALEAERRKLDQRVDAETEAWNDAREKLEDAVRAAER